MIETWGRGIQKVFDECRKHGCPPPVYEVTSGNPGDIQVRIDAAPDAIASDDAEERGKDAGAHGATANATVNATPNETVDATVTGLILETIRTNPGIRRPRLLLLLPSVKRGTLTRKLSDLSDLIEFRGAPKTGGYFLKEKTAGKTMQGSSPAIASGAPEDATVSATANATLSATASATVTELIIEAIRTHPGIRRPQLLSLIPSVKRGTLTRRLATMPDLIEFRGAPKTGGYFLKDPKNESQPLLPSHGKKRNSP